MAVLKNIVSKIFNLSTTPAKKTEGQFWYDTTNNVLKRSDGSDYKPLAVGDNLISVGSTDTVKGILDSKANASDLASYLPLTGGIIARAEENPDNPILTIQDTQYGFGWPMAGLLVKGGMYNDLTDDYDYYSTYIRPDEITGDAVTSSITSGSRQLLTSGGAYTALQNKADNTNVVHLSGDEVITGNKLFTSSIRFSSGDTFNTNLAALSVPDPDGISGPPPTLIIDSNSNITIDASNVSDSDLYYDYDSYGIISGVNSDGETFRFDG